MKYFMILLVLFLSTNLFSQNGEFTTHSNGLIYSKSTMSKLYHIVDSLNLKYKSCDLNKTYYSKSQTIGHLVKLKNVDIKQAKIDIENNIDFKSFASKYQNAEIKKDILIVKFKFENYKGEEIVEFSEITISNGSGTQIIIKNNPAIYDKELKNNWLLKKTYSGKFLNAFYFPNNFKSKPLKEEYTRMIGYSDCLVDTTTIKINKDAKSGWVDLPKNWEKFSQKRKESLLERMRNTKVMGTCSMDSSPRYHAMNIAVLSAETTNWEVFLRAHLDIMNDRFDRASDGSYAWKERKTYINELEQLDINVSDLIFGISLRIENPSKNHYYGSIGRIGRALSETQNRSEIEGNILSMIKDTELDDYNRIISYFLFLNYNHYIENEELKKENELKLKKSISFLPDYLKTKIENRNLK